MTFEQLRLKHPRLTYTRYRVTREDSSLVISYEFLLEPDIRLQSVVTVPFSGVVTDTILEPFVFNLGLIEAISYWKLACPREFVVEAGHLTSEQVRFWYDLFIHGLGEFYYQNQIDFTMPDFLDIRSSDAIGQHNVWDKSLAQRVVNNSSFPTTHQAADLVLVGGGKDSAVTLGMIKQGNRTLQTIVLNPTKAASDVIRSSGFPAPLIVKRTLDPKLLDLNGAGYLNGHTPFSAYIAFLGVLVSSLTGSENVIVSNERSANEGNVSYRGMEVNHQYSKSFRFETMFRQYCIDTFEQCGSYFSLLRPLNDMQIAAIFATYPQFFTTFRSCNKGAKTGVWCGACAKCAFTYLTLSPYMSHEQMRISFGADLFASTAIIEHIRALVGLVPVKPFECVGTRDEAKLAVILVVEKYLEEHREVPEGVLKIKSDLFLSRQDVVELRHLVLDTWGDTYNLPPEYVSLLRAVWQTIGR